MRIRHYTNQRPTAKAGFRKINTFMTPVLFRILISLYSFIFSCGATLARALLAPFPFVASWEIKKRWQGPKPLTAITGDVVWLHAASLGECKVLIRFLDILREKNNADFYLVTATTKTGFSYLSGHRAPDIVSIGYLPMDTIGRMKKTLQTFKVKRLWLVETELWPSMIWACKSMKIPLGIINARVEEQSLAAYKRLGLFLSPLLTYPTIVLAQNEIYAKRFEQLQIPAKNIHVTGNIKSYVTVRQCPAKDRATLRAALQLSESEPCITFGCIHAEEAVHLKATIDMLEESGYHCKSIIVPRYLRESNAIAKEFGVTTPILTDIATEKTWKVCVIHKIGILDALYKISDAAFIGGTFDTTGAHNMWDAAQFGIPVFFGPDIHTQQESAKTLTQAGVAFAASSSADLAQAIRSVLLDNHKKFLNNLDNFMKTTNSKSNTVKDLIP